MSAAFSTTKPACRAGFGSIGMSRSRLPTMLRAIRRRAGAGLLPHQAGENVRHFRRRHCATAARRSGRRCSRVLPSAAVCASDACLRQRIDAGAAHRVIGQRVGVHRDEQRRAVLLRRCHPLFQRDEHVARRASAPPGSGPWPPTAAATRARWPARRASHRCRTHRSRPDPCRHARDPASRRQRRLRRRALAAVARRSVAAASGRPASRAAGTWRRCQTRTQGGPATRRREIGEPD